MPSADWKTFAVTTSTLPSSFQGNYEGSPRSATRMGFPPWVHRRSLLSPGRLARLQKTPGRRIIVVISLGMGRSAGHEGVDDLWVENERESDFADASDRRCCRRLWMRFGATAFCWQCGKWC